MDLTPYVENLRRELAVAAEAGGEDARALAERLTAPLESAVRLMLLDALSAAADEITRELAPGSVELRLRAGEPDFVVTPPPADEPVEPRARRRAAARAAGRRRGRDGAHQPSPAGAAQGRRRAGRRPRAALRQRLARPRRRRRARARRPRRGRASAAARARPDLHRLGALTARPIDTDRSNPTPGGHPMPTFDTPEPITATIDLAIGDVRITAGDRSDDRRRRAPQRRVQRRRRQGRRADPRRVRERPAARQGAEAALWFSRSDGGSIDVTIELPAGSHVHGTGRRRRLPLRRPARRVPAQDRPRARPARSADALNLKSGIGDINVEPRDRPRRDHDRLGRRPRARARRQRGDQELQRRHVDRRRRRRPAGQRANGSIAVDLAQAERRRQVLRTATSGSARSCAARSCSRPRLGDLEVGIREGTAAWLDVSSKLGARPQRPRRRRRPRAVGPRRSRSARARRSARSRSGAPDGRRRRAVGLRAGGGRGRDRARSAVVRLAVRAGPRRARARREGPARPGARRAGDGGARGARARSTPASRATSRCCTPRARTCCCRSIWCTRRPAR